MKFKTAVFLFKATFIFRCIKRSAFVAPKEKNRSIGQSLAKLIVFSKVSRNFTKCVQQL